MPGEQTRTWVILTPEYPPDIGGVADHSRQIAEILAAAGHRVMVAAKGDGPGSDERGVRVMRFPEGLGIRGLVRLSRDLTTAAAPLRVLLAHVPTAFGYRGMNLAIPIWLRTGLPPRTLVDLMFHEVATPWMRRPLRWNVVAAASRLTALMLLRRADRIFVSTPAWEPMLRRLGARDRTISRLPVMSPLPTRADSKRSAQIRSRLLGSQATSLVGHFGTSQGQTAGLHTRVFGEVLELRNVACLFIGKGSRQFARDLAARMPRAADRIHGVGVLEARDAADHLAACDLALQPYPDGITLRRTSAMAALGLGVPTVTNRGRLTEAEWDVSESVILTSEEELAERVACLLARGDVIQAVGEAGRAFYEAHCSIASAVTSLEIQPQRPRP